MRDPGIDEGATLVIHTAEQRSWFWYIPLPHDRVSVGVVGSVEHLVRGRAGDLARVFWEEVADCAPLGPRLAGARQVMDFLATRDVSYHSRQIAGDGWVLVGDALGFLDPIYSSGVLLACSSGEFAADAIVAALAAGDCSGARLGAFGPRFLAGMDAMRRLVYTFYDPDFRFSKFIRRFPHDDNAPHDGIGGFDLDSSHDRAFAYDFDRSGKQDHIVLYRPGTGIVWIVGPSSPRPMVPYRPKLR